MIELDNADVELRVLELQTRHYSDYEFIGERGMNSL